MTIQGSFQILSVMAILLALAIPLGVYIYRVFTGRRSWFEPAVAPVERVLYRLIGVDPTVEMDWKAYIKSLLLLNFVMLLFAFLTLRIMGHLPVNPDHVPSMPWALAFNTAASFTTNTDWQNYAGGSQMTYFGQMFPIVFLQFTSAATGLVSAIAFLRALANSRSKNLGNFWVDIIFALTRIMLPIAFVSAIVLIALGVPETFLGSQTAHTLQGATQIIHRGPVAALEAIKQLGTNGGGFFNTNSAHPFENPNALSNVIEILLMGLVSTALVTTFGMFLKNRKMAIVLYVFLTSLLLIGAFVVYGSEAAGNPILTHLLGIRGPNMEGKEVAYGLPLTSMFVSSTTAYSTGAVDAMHDSLTPLGSMVPFAFMMFNMVFGGKGVGILNIILFLIITVFLSGLMVGRTPEIFGKKIEAKEIKLATFALLVHPFVILVPTAIALLTKTGVASMGNPGFQGFSEVLYAFTSGAANNGSAFAGLNGDTTFYNIAIGLVMMFGRYVSIIAMLAIAGLLTMKPIIPASSGTLRTDTFSFGWVFMAVVFIVGALTFFPALSLGPIATQIQMWSLHLAH
ncbi:potassium-transporting ATPase subunit KdpA [Alicyclobacillus sp. SP_1]|uniref:potassium-transporting ATPase subunit KdpA n=1 Tax=Alicyclobacillus sp. SP_1 TaxID=2942475 RepID=UPI0021585C4D|nr:potassium-transporting ATPase subunit KdpA [Alicyclobacillus sp. SP_1]